MSSHKNMGPSNVTNSASLMVSGADQLLFASDQVIMADNQQSNTMAPNPPSGTNSANLTNSSAK